MFVQSCQKHQITSDQIKFDPYGKFLPWSRVFGMLIACDPPFANRGSAAMLRCLGNGFERLLPVSARSMRLEDLPNALCPSLSILSKRINFLELQTSLLHSAI
jgi:hypothetical protein